MLSDTGGNGSSLYLTGDAVVSWMVTVGNNVTPLFVGGSSDARALVDVLPNYTSVALGSSWTR
jgi:hypothetical protein